MEALPAQLRRFQKVVSHPIRVSMLRLLSAEEERSSPKDFAAALGISLSLAAYHTKLLSELGAIEMVDVQPIRGTFKHVYSITPLGRTIIKALDVLISSYKEEPEIPEPGKTDDCNASGSEEG